LNPAEHWAAGELLDWDTSTGSVINMDLAREWYWECHKSG